MGLLAAMLLYALHCAAVEPPAAEPPAAKPPFEQLLESLESPKSPSAPAPADAQKAAPSSRTSAIPGATHDAQDIGGVAYELLQRQDELQRQIVEMKRESMTAQRRFDSFMTQMGRHKVEYTASQLKWIGELEQSVASQTTQHLKELDRRLMHLQRQHQVLQDCGGRPERAKTKWGGEQKVEIAERCSRDVPVIARYLGRLNSILKAEHSRMMSTYETAERQMQTTEAATLRQQRRTSSPFER